MIRRALKWGGAFVALALCLLLILVLKPVPVTIAAIQPRADTEYWRMPGGYRIAYSKIPRRAGVPEKPPVIFLHGGPGGYVHSAIIRTLAPLAAEGRDIYLYDQSGTGLSDRRAKPKDTSIAGHLADLEIIRRQIGVDKVALVGHSFGGLLAALYAAEHPDRIDRLVLSSPGQLMPERFDADGSSANERLYPVPAAYRFTPPKDYAEVTSAGTLPLRAIASLTLATLFNVKLASDREMDAALNSMASRFTRTMVCDPRHVLPEEGGAGAYSRTGTNFYPDGFADRRPAMRKMTAPVLVLQGQCDFLSYADAFEYAATFPNGAYRFLPGAGHLIWWDKPDAYRQAIAQFLRR